MTFPVHNLKKYKVKYFLYIFYKLVNLIFSILQPFIFAKILNLVYDKDIKKTYIYISILLLCYLIKSFTSYISDSTKNYVNNYMIEDIKADMIKAVIYFKTCIFDKTKIGEFVSKFHSDVIAIVDFIVDYIPTIFIEIFKIIIIGIVISSVDYKLMLMLLLGAIIVTSIFIRFGKKIRKKYIEFRKIADIYFSNMYETMTNIREIKNLGIRDICINKSIGIFDDIRKGENEYENLCLLSELVTTIIDNIVIIIVMFWSSYLVFSSSMSVDKFIIFFSYSAQFSSSLKVIASLNSKIQASSVSFKRVYEIIFDSEKIENLSRCTNKINNIEKIEMKKVSFSYSENIKVLDKISMSFNENGLVAIVGPSGNGKSTILHILNRLYDTYDGEVLFNNINLKSISEESLRCNITRVFQEPLMFNISIFDNFKIIKRDITKEEIIKYCKKAYIHDFIISLPEGYDTIINENSSNISIGQKQRLAIARALASGAKVLLFDEITSSLDNEAQEYINKTINEIKRNHIIVVVSHKISNITNANKIYVVNKGKIENKGTHEYLLGNCKLYKELYELELSVK